MPKRNPKVEIYEDASGEWRWRIVSSNNQIVCTSHESFTKGNAKRAAKKAIASIGLLEEFELKEISQKGESS